MDTLHLEKLRQEAALGGKEEVMRYHEAVVGSQNDVRDAVNTTLSLNISIDGSFHFETPADVPEHLLEVIKSVKFDSVNDELMQRACKMINLKTLEVFGCEEVTDLGLQGLSRLSQLESLSLLRASNATDESVEVISHLKALKKLELFAWEKISDQALAFLSSLPDLEELRIGYCTGLNGVGIGHLKLSPNIKLLDLTFADIDEQVLEGLLKQNSNIKYLSLELCEEINDACLEAIVKFSELEELYLGVVNERITTEGINALKDLKTLKEVRLYPGRSDSLSRVIALKQAYVQLQREIHSRK